MPLGHVTARGVTRRFFSGPGRFELFSRNRRIKRPDRKPLASNSSVLNTLDSMRLGFGVSKHQRSSIYFPGAWGAVKNSRIFKRGPRGSTARISAKFRKTFLLVVDAHDSSAADDCCGEVSRSNRGSFLVARSNAGGSRVWARQRPRSENSVNSIQL